jgi:hypothetical protein
VLARLGGFNGVATSYECVRIRGREKLFSRESWKDLPRLQGF